MTSPGPGSGQNNPRDCGASFFSDETGIITLIVSIAALVFSLGTLISDMIRNRNILIHDLQVDGQVFHRTLLQLDRLQCVQPSRSSSPTNRPCSDNGFFEPTPDTHGREILLQRAEYLEKRIVVLLKKLDMPEFGYITPVDYRTLAKAELKDLNFEKSHYFIDREFRTLKVYRNHPGYVIRSIHADLIRGWYRMILEKKSSHKHPAQDDFDRAIAQAQSRVIILPMRNYLVVFILQSEGCARWLGESLFTHKTVSGNSSPEFTRTRTILENEPPSISLLHELRRNQKTLDSGNKNALLKVCTKLFDQI
ncbi:MAG: protein of unknown function [Leptospirillum rubarum]|jgi:hypothetical protein|nr:MAG: protein of unknown function [Leptospirillum rubarum]